MSSLSLVGTTRDGTQIMLLKEGTSQTRGRESLNNNINAAATVATMLKTVLGPRGMDKMLVDSMGGITITNDGATILKEMDIQHPAAKMMVEIAKAVDTEVGDGTTSSVIIAGALLENARGLILQGIHPTLVIDGYRKAMMQALDILNKIAEEVKPHSDRSILNNIARTSMESKLVSVDSDVLADLAVDAVMAVSNKVTQSEISSENSFERVDLDNIKIQKKSGGAMRDSSLIKGIIVDKEIAHSAMPRKVTNANILLLNIALEIKKTEYETKITINMPTQMQSFLDEETKMLKSMADKIVNAKINVVICQKGIDDIVLEYFAKANILAVKSVKESDINALAKATGARIVSRLEDISEEDLGFAGGVEEKTIDNSKLVFVQDCMNPKAVSMLIRGGSERVVDEAERSMHDAMMAVKDVVQKPAIVAGGGSSEAFVSNKLRTWASSVSGRQHYAIKAFADALDSIPTALAENAGMDVIDTLATLRSKQQSENSPWIGVDVKNLKVAEMKKRNIIEPLAVKEQVLKSATEATAMLLRIDDVLSASRPAGS